MIVYGFYAHGVHELVKALRRYALKKRIRLALFPDAVNNVISRMELIDHFLDHVNVILQVRVDGDGHVTHVLRSNQPCSQRKLMSHVARQLHAAYLHGMRLMFFLDQLPGAVFTSVIYK